MRILPTFLAVPLALAAQIPEIRTTAQDRTALSVTIYQNGLAAIRDTRRVRLPAGPSCLAFADLLPSLRPKSAVLIDSDAGIHVRERNYTFDLLSPANLVDASLGQPVRILDPRKPDIPGTLASAPLRNPPFRANAKLLDRVFRKPEAFVQAPDSEVLIETNRGLVAKETSQLAFSSLPTRLLVSPTLTQTLDVKDAGLQPLTLLYTATDLSWEVHYLSSLDQDGGHMDLAAFATVKNNTDMALAESSLQLVAGAPHVVYDPPPGQSAGALADTTTATVEVVASSAPSFKEEKLSEYPVFALDRKVSIASHASKQLKLFEANRIPVQLTVLVESPWQPWNELPSLHLKHHPIFLGAPGTDSNNPDSGRAQTPATVWRGTIQNSKASHLGRALPMGMVTIQYEDPAGARVLLPGSGFYASEFPPTAPGDDIDLDLGPAKAVHAQRWAEQPTRHTIGFFRHLWGVLWNEPGMTTASNLHRWTYRMMVQVSNALTNPISAIIREPVGAGWVIRSASHPRHQTGPNAWDFQMTVPAQGKATLTYLLMSDPEETTLPQTRD